jgi:hypothetical protein
MVSTVLILYSVQTHKQLLIVLFLDGLFSAVFVRGLTSSFKCNFCIQLRIVLDDKKRLGQVQSVRPRGVGVLAFFYIYFLADFFIVLFPFDFRSSDLTVIGIKTARYFSAILRYNVVLAILFQ